MQDMFTQIANLGFPIVLSIYLLVRLEAKMDKLSATIEHLSDSVEKMRDTRVLQSNV